MLLFTYLSLHCCDKYLDCLQWSICAICFLLLQPPWFIWKIIDTVKRYDAMTCRIHLFFFVSCWRQQDVSFAACHTFASVQQEGYRRLLLGEKGATAWRWTVPSHNVEVKNEWSCTSYFPLYLRVLHKVLLKQESNSAADKLIETQSWFHGSWVKFNFCNE